MPKGIYKRIIGVNCGKGVNNGFTDKTHSKKDLEKMKLARLKNPIDFWSGKKRPELAGKNHWNWKGDKIEYIPLHTWIRRKLGTPLKCEHCGKIKTNTRNMHWANKDGKYKRVFTDWIRLCRQCHVDFDKLNNTHV